jgi:surfactin synthase thioesterase subunit/predicted MFS family arabinose efflux permease
MGGALTVAIARLLEAAQVELVGVFIGGHFPVPRLPGKLFDSLAKLFPMERWTSQRQALDFLRAMGFFTDLLDPREQAFVMRSFLHDARNGEDYYTDIYAQREISKLRAPMMCIFGEMDRATELYQERYTEWEYFAETVEMTVIPHAGHYFLKHQPTDLARIIVDRWTSWKTQTAAPRSADEQHLAQSLTAPSMGASERAPQEMLYADGSKQQVIARHQPRVSPSLRTFFLVAIGQFISLIGTGLTAFAMGIWVYQQTQSISAFALISVLALLPAILFAPIAGAVADRFDRRLIMIVSDILAASSTIGLTTLLWLDALQIWHIYLIVSVHAIANAFQQPAYVAAITQLVPKRYYGRANGIVQLGTASGGLLAPLIGGALVLLIGLHGIVLIDFATFLIAITIMLLVRFPQTLFKKREEPFLQEIVGGWRYIIKRHGLVAIIMFTVAVNYLFSIVEVLATPLTLSFGSTNALGVVLAASGAGLLAGSLLMSIWGGTVRRTEGILGAVVLIGLSMLTIGAYPATIFPMIGLFGMGFAVSILNTHWLSIVQAKVGLELQGRVLSTTNMLAWSMAPLGYLTAGPLAEAVFEPLMMQSGLFGDSIGRLIGAGQGRGMGLMMILAGLITLVLAALAYRYKPIRLLEDDLPDTLPDAMIVADKDRLQQQMDYQLTLVTP